MFSGSLQAARTYGACTLGIADTEWRAMRKTAALVMSPTVRGRSLSGLLAVHGDPTWRPATAPLSRWAREVYDAATGAGDEAISLEELGSLWNMSLPKDAPKNWRGIRGFLDALHLTARRLSWKTDTPFEWTLDSGGGNRPQTDAPAAYEPLLKRSGPAVAPKRRCEICRGHRGPRGNSAPSLHRPHPGNHAQEKQISRTPGRFGRSARSNMDRREAQKSGV